MPLATTRQGSLHYEIADQVTPSRAPREAILFHHGIGASAAIWAGWFPALADAMNHLTADAHRWLITAGEINCAPSERYTL